MKNKNLIFSFLTVVTLTIGAGCLWTSCDDWTETEQVDYGVTTPELNARLDALTNDLESLNTSISSFQDAMQGLVLITEYSMDEKGNYTLKMSDGTELTVYSGLPDEDIPVLGVSEDGYWTYTLNGDKIV